LAVEDDSSDSNSIDLIDYDDIVKDSKKYHYFIMTSEKIIKLGASNDKSEAKIEALNTLKPKMEILIGKKIIYLKIKETENKKEFFLSSKLGPISLIFEPAIIKSNNEIKNLKEGGNNLIYLSKKFIKENKENLLKDYKKIVRQFYNEKISKSSIDVKIL
jgi:hypothetical protein